MLNDIDELAQLQLIPADGAVAEASPGQFEINLYHTDNVLEACDDALALKRLVRLMGNKKHKMHATFMAKPYEEHAGSGMHIHISMQNNRGENVLSDAEGEDSPLLKKMLAGMIDLMPSSMALLAPNGQTRIAASSRECMCRRRRRGAITTAPSPCVFRAATVIITAWNIAWRVPMPTHIW